VKITQEDKRTTRFDGEETIEQTVNIQFDCLEAEKSRKATDSGYNLGALNFHGYIGLTLPIEEFKESGYEIGKVFALTAT
jgi:hypothetical protein